VDTPVFAAIATDFDKFLLTALEKRPDIGQVRMELKSKNIEVRYYRNQLLPDLQVSASYYTSGLAGDRLIFEGDPLFGGTVIGVIKSDVWASMKDVLSNVYRNYSFGLQLSVPLKNDSARADLIQAQLALKQTLLQLKQTESTIYSDVKQIVMDIEYGLKLVDATRISRELAEQKLISEQKKLAVGLSYNYLVLQFQRDLANARIAELKAMIDYNLAMARINKVLGETFEAHHIEFNDFLQKS
jgi:outer membrane protein TolC